MPGVIGLAVVISMRTRYPIVRSLLYSEKIIDVPAVDAALERYGNRQQFDRTLNVASWLLAGSFFLSAVLRRYRCLQRRTREDDRPELSGHRAAVDGGNDDRAVVPAEEHQEPHAHGPGRDFPPPSSIESGMNRAGRSGEV